MANEPSPDSGQPTKSAAVLQVILPHREELRILVLPEGSGWALPRFATDGLPDDAYDLFEFGMNQRTVLGCAAETLYSPYFERSSDEHGFRFAFVMNNLDPAFQVPNGARWIAREELDDLALADEYLRPTIARYFYERVTGDYPPERPTWGFAGWSEQASRWIAAQVEAQGWRLEGEIEMVRKWCITCVLKVPTSAGDLYFKAVPPTFAREVAVTRFLAELHPENLPTIVAADEAERWLLLRDFGGTLLGDSKNVADWERALRDFAALQVTMSRQIGALFQCDAMDYRLEVLLEKLDVLLADEEILKPNRQITAEEIERARQLAPRIKALIAELQGYRLPATVVHSDFHPWNIAVNEDRIIFFDWTDAAVGHPFYDLAPLSLIASRIFPDQPETIAHLREAYLEGWTSFAPLETLRKALLLGEALGVLQKAITYRHLLRCLEPNERWSVDNTGGAVKDLLTKVEALQKK